MHETQATLPGRPLVLAPQELAITATASDETVVPFTFTKQYLSYFEGETASFQPEQVANLTALGVGAEGLGGGEAARSDDPGRIGGDRQGPDGPVTGAAPRRSPGTPGHRDYEPPTQGEAARRVGADRGEEERGHDRVPDRGGPAPGVPHPAPSPGTPGRGQEAHRPLGDAPRPGPAPTPPRGAGGDHRGQEPAPRGPGR